MKFLPDQVVARLQTELQTPDLSGTRYRALKFLGQGGMAIVWLAEDSILRRPVALKILSAEKSSADLPARLMQEAVILARLEHPGIVPVHDAGTLPDGCTFYCMKHVEGQTLDHYIGRLGLRQRLQLLQRIAEPLAFAHSRGIIHRDLKPANIMVGSFGEVLIMDWGLARVIENSAAAQQNPAASDEGGPPTAERSPAFSPGLYTTVHGTVLGTPGFMAPEQERGDVNATDQRTDVFAFGAILNYILRDNTTSSDRERGPRSLHAICRKAMSSEMAGRYSTVQELSADLGKYLDNLPVSAYRENIVERAARLIARHRVAVVLVLAYLFMRVLFVLFSR
ncbi:MAG TPA: serine/threonine-protein kinase [Candidatus Angelobacter sp.]|jgi:serine/threonine protein kinase